MMRFDLEGLLVSHKVTRPYLNKEVTYIIIVIVMTSLILAPSHTVC